MNKVIGVFAILAIAVAASMLLTPQASAFPTIHRKDVSSRTRFRVQALRQSSAPACC